MVEKGVVSAGVVAIIPMKALDEAKSRLAPRLSQGQRRALALNMLEHVIRQASRASLASVWVAGGGPVVRCLAEGSGAQWHEDETAGLNDCLTEAFALASRQGLAPLYLPGDLALVDWPEIQTLTSFLRLGTGLVVCPDERNEGTNALLLPPGSGFQPLLGRGSFRRHLESAQGLGLEAAIYNSPGLAFDLDTPGDLEEMERRSPGILETLVQERVI